MLLLLRQRAGFNPASIPDLALWADASRLALSSGDRAPAISNVVAGGAAISQATASKQAYFYTNMLRGRGCLRFPVSLNPFAYTIASGLSLSRQNHSVFAICRFVQTGNTLQHALSNLGNAEAFYGTLGSQVWGIFDGATRTGVSTVVPRSSWMLCGYTSSASGLTFYMDELSTSIAASPAATLTGGTLGANTAVTSQGFKGDLLDYMVYNRALSAIEYAALRTQFAIVGRGLPSVHTHNIVFLGDSLTYGSGSGRGGTYPFQTLDLLGLHWRATCPAVHGRTLATMQTNIAVDATNRYDATRTRNVAAAWGSTNDLDAGTAVATAQTNYQAYCQSLRATGYRVLAFTILPRVSSSGTFETDRQTFNTWLRANWTAFADAMIDVAADSRIGDAGDNLDTTYYYTDSIHLNDTGNTIVSALVATASIA